MSSLPCTNCSGHGTMIIHDQTIECEKCGGWGKVFKYPDWYRNMEDLVIHCGNSYYTISAGWLWTLTDEGYVHTSRTNPIVNRTVIAINHPEAKKMKKVEYNKE